MAVGRYEGNSLFARGDVSLPDIDLPVVTMIAD